MKHIVLFPILVFSMFAHAEGVPVLSDLVGLEWKNRVIVVNETKNEDVYLKLLKEQVAEIDDRDIIWFIIKGHLALTNYSGRLSPEFVSNMRERLGPVQGKVILIGKDGGIKSQSDYLNLEAIFSEIDAMPMRQLEMHQ
jgi:DNA repair exonuclease SbcCD nuclease subunit